MYTDNQRQIAYRDVLTIWIRKEGANVVYCKLYSNCRFGWNLSVSGAQAQIFYDEYVAYWGAANVFDNGEYVLPYDNVVNVFYSPTLSSPNDATICIDSKKFNDIPLSGADAVAFRDAYAAYVAGGGGGGDSNPPIYLKYEPSSDTIDGTGSGFNDSGQVWDAPAMILHSFGAEYTRLQVFFAFAITGDLNGEWNLYCRDFDATSSADPATAIQSPVPGSILSLRGPFASGGLLVFDSTPEFDCIPGRVFNIGGKRFGAASGLKLTAATFKFSAP